MGENRTNIEAQIEAEINKLVPLIEEHIYSFENDEIEKSIGNILNETKSTLGVAESCTGGYLSHLLTSIPGSSSYFMGGVVSYSNQAKMDVLQVIQETLTKFGAVSEPTVIEMAEGVLNLMKTTYGIATSGIAGPDGGTEEAQQGHHHQQGNQPGWRDLCQR